MKSLAQSLRRQLYRKGYQIYPHSAVLDRPIFIIGCGRSGTTILGQVLARHPQLAYLNEPRQIWFNEPKTDVWSETQIQQGQLKLRASDVNAESAAAILQAFAAEVRAQNAKRLVEKLPINSFRVEFINKMFPDALFVYLVRNGVDVANSIAKLSQQWFKHTYRWQLLAEYARERGEADLVDLCTNDFLKGLLEWRLSNLCAQASFSLLSGSRVLEIRYEKLIQNPVDTCKIIENFVGIEPSDRLYAFASQKILPPSTPSQTISPEAALIAGDLLKQLGYGR